MKKKPNRPSAASWRKTCTECGASLNSSRRNKRTCPRCGGKLRAGPNLPMPGEPFKFGSGPYPKPSAADVRVLREIAADCQNHIGVEKTFGTARTVRRYEARAAALARILAWIEQEQKR